MANNVEVVKYNSAWNKMFKVESQKIELIVKDDFVGAYHVGSTAIKGMNARAILDILVVLKKGKMTEQLITKFIEKGYEYLGDGNISDSFMFSKKEEEVDYQIRLFDQNSIKDIRRLLAVKNYLMSNPKELEVYNNLKNDLMAKETEEPGAYEAGKSEYLDALEVKALKWQLNQEFLGKYMSMGMCVGMSSGCAIGYVLSDMVPGICIGIAMGMILGFVVGRRKIKQQEQES